MRSGPASGVNCPSVSFFGASSHAGRGPGVLPFARIPLAGLDTPPGVLGAMVGQHGEAAHGLVAQARAQPLEQPRPVFRLAGCVAEHAAAAAGQRREIAGFETHRLHRLRQDQVAEPLAQQLRHALGIARREARPISTKSMHLHAATPA
jgi:hypothetical protein